MQTFVEANWPTLLACDTSQELPSQQRAKSKQEKLLIVAAKIAHIWWYICQAQSLKNLSLIITVHSRRDQNIHTFHLPLLKPLLRLHNQGNKHCVCQLEAICRWGNLLG